MNIVSQIIDNRHTTEKLEKKDTKKNPWMIEFSFPLLNEEIKCYFIIDLYFHPGQRKSYNDTIPQVGRESTLFGKHGKKVELYNKFSAHFFQKAKREKKNLQKKPTQKPPNPTPPKKPNQNPTFKIHCQWSGDYPEKKTFLNRFSRDWM